MSLHVRVDILYSAPLAVRQTASGYLLSLSLYFLLPLFVHATLFLLCFFLYFSLIRSLLIESLLVERSIRQELATHKDFLVV